MRIMIVQFLTLFFFLSSVSGVLQMWQLDAATNAKKTAKKLSASKLRWPKGVVPYTIEDGVADKENIDSAIGEWNSKTVIEFVPHRKQRSYVAIVGVEGGNCRAALGRVCGKQEIFYQPVSKVPWEARRAPAVARREVRRMAIRVISSDERQSRRPQMSVAQRVTRRFRSAA